MLIPPTKSEPATPSACAGDACLTTRTTQVMIDKDTIDQLLELIAQISCSRHTLEDYFYEDKTEEDLELMVDRLELEAIRVLMAFAAEPLTCEEDRGSLRLIAYCMRRARGDLNLPFDIATAQVQ